MTAQLLIPAAGEGARLGADLPKALVPVAGLPLLIRTLRRFEPLNLVAQAVVAVPPGRQDAFRAVLAEAFPDNRITLIPGGAERQDSVARALDALRNDTRLVVIHDAARPFVAPETVQAAIDAAEKHGAATVAEPCVDTILLADDQAYLQTTPDRERLWSCLTPQVFHIDLVRDAHRRAAENGERYTDDATLVHAAGTPVKIVPGRGANRKITTVDDLRYSEYLLEKDHA